VCFMLRSRGNESTIMPKSSSPTAAIASATRVTFDHILSRGIPRGAHTHARARAHDSVPDELMLRPPLRREVPLGVVPLELERKHDRALVRDDHRRVCARTDRSRAAASR
jgi:hypothetical protein